MSNTIERLPNGLTQAQVDARPEPYVGMLHYYPDDRSWELTVARYECADWQERWHALLPGEPGCPPVPFNFQHAWKEGDRAWVLDADGWHVWTVALYGEGLYFGSGQGYLAIDTPALYVPEGE